jgi:hypothetical protein
LRISRLRWRSHLNLDLKKDIDFYIVLYIYRIPIFFYVDGDGMYYYMYIRLVNQTFYEEGNQLCIPDITTMF